MELRAYKDKIYVELKHDNIRDKILNGSLRRDEYDDDDVYEFLKLLKRRGGYVAESNKIVVITEKKWILTVKKAKKEHFIGVFQMNIQCI